MLKQYKSRLARITGVFIIALAALASVVQMGAADGSGYRIYLPLVSGGNGNFPNCRLGVGVAQGSIANYNYKPLNIGWYTDWGVHLPAVDDLGYYPVIRVTQDKSITNTYLPSYHITPTLTFDPGGLGSIVQAHTGQTWIIGNEIDRVGQNATLPDMYAQVYHDAYEFVKGIDPTAKVSIGSVIEITPLRLQYLDMVLAAYRAKFGVSMPIDVWNTHFYILREVANYWGASIPPGINVITGTLYTPPQNIDINIFKSQVMTLRTWMKSHGYQDRPLIVTEYGALMPLWWLDDFGVTQSDMNNFNQQAANYMYTAIDPSLGYALDGYRLVQQSALYSLDDDTPYYNDFSWGTFLFRSTSPYTLTSMGAFYRDHIATSILANVDLYPYRWATSPTPLIISPSSTITPLFSVSVVNAGNTYAPVSPTLRFFDVTDDPAILVGDAVLPPSEGCGSMSSASIIWPNLGVGVHQMRIVVDPDNQIIESLKTNNVMTATVLVGTQGVYLPLIER
jgi:hypothetical protein